MEWSFEIYCSLGNECGPFLECRHYSKCPPKSYKSWKKMPEDFMSVSRSLVCSYFSFFCMCLQILEITNYFLSCLVCYGDVPPRLSFKNKRGNHLQASQNSIDYGPTNDSSFCVFPHSGSICKLQVISLSQWQLEFHDNGKEYEAQPPGQDSTERLTQM